MDTLPHNFYFDPVRQGTGKSVWNWYNSAPYQNGAYLVLTSGSGLSFYDCGKGNISFVINTPDPTGGVARQWGLKAGEDYILFDVSANTFQAKTSSMTGLWTSSVDIPWDSAWTNTDTTFSFLWEAGICTFFVNTIKRAQISNASIPHGPMSPFVSNNGGDTFMIESVAGRGLQTLILNPTETSADTWAPMVPTKRETITTSEAITITNSSLADTVISDTISASSETATVTDSLDTASGVSDSMTVGENTLDASNVIVQMTFDQSVSDTITATDVIADTQFA